MTENVGKNTFNAGVSVLPHPEKVAKGGEDAYSLNPRLLAVADGVGGWIESGVDPANFSRELCANIDEIA